MSVDNAIITASFFVGLRLQAVKKFTYASGESFIHLQFEGTDEILEVVKGADDFETGEPGYLVRLDPSDLDGMADPLAEWTEQVILEEFECYMDGEGRTYSDASIVRQTDYGEAHDGPVWPRVYVQCLIDGGYVDFEVCIGAQDDVIEFEEV